MKVGMESLGTNPLYCTQWYCDPGTYSPLPIHTIVRKEDTVSSDDLEIPHIIKDG